MSQPTLNVLQQSMLISATMCFRERGRVMGNHREWRSVGQRCSRAVWSVQAMASKKPGEIFFLGTIPPTDIMINSSGPKVRKYEGLRR